MRDGRILRALLDLLKIHPRAGAAYLADYGDPAACPAVLAVISAFESGSVERTELMDVVDAYASLGGELPADVKARLPTWMWG